MQRTKLLGGLFVLTLASLLQGEDWIQWRGPQRDGISRDTAVVLPWKSAPKVLWERAIGAAFSAVTGLGDVVYTCGTEEKKQVLFCLNATTGDVVWKVAFEPECKDRQGGDGTRATPTIDAGKVYIFGALGTVLCVDAKTGKEVWSRKFSNKPQWAYSGSVLIEGDLAVAYPGKGDGGMAAFNKVTGEPVWKAGDDGAGYATAYPFTFGGKRYLAGHTATQAIIVDAQTGRIACSIPWKTSYDVNASTPIFHDGHLFLTSGYGVGCALFKLEVAGDKIEAKEVWRNKTIRNKFHTCVLTEGKLYSGDEEALKCIDFLTGATAWRKDDAGGEKTVNGSLILSGGHILFLSEKGQLQVAKADPKDFVPLGSVKVLGGRCWTVPTIHNGRLYVRNFEKVVCLDLRG